MKEVAEMAVITATLTADEEATVVAVEDGTNQHDSSASVQKQVDIATIALDGTSSGVGSGVEYCL